jgi:hypothetical protein
MMLGSSSNRMDSRDSPAMMEFLIGSRNESRGRRAETEWFRNTNNRRMLVYIAFWLTIIAIAVAL